MKILLLDKYGQLGWELQRALAPLGELIACGRDQADLCQVQPLVAMLRALRPAVVVNAAAYTDVSIAPSQNPNWRQQSTPMQWRRWRVRPGPWGRGWCTSAQTTCSTAAPRRPMNGRLDTHKFRHAFCLTLPPWRDGVDRMLTEVLGSAGGSSVRGHA